MGKCRTAPTTPEASEAVEQDQHIGNRTEPGGSAPGPEGPEERFLPVPGAQLIDDRELRRDPGREGIDIVAPEGTPVHAVSGGTVASSGPTGHQGTMVQVRDRLGRRYSYAGLRDGSVTVQPGQRVEAGQILGVVGAARLPALHLAIEDPDGRQADPYDELVGLPDPNELGYRLGADIDPGATDEQRP
jgi:murein DD-endopeptidase MepM/ murein hydrolase activator NlpD